MHALVRAWQSSYAVYGKGLFSSFIQVQVQSDA